MSPLLFTVYVDELLARLARSKAGCYIGNVYAGSLGYADDMLLLAPTLHSLKTLLRVFTEFADEYHVIFNPDKTKFIMCKLVDTPVPAVTFMHKSIKCVPMDNHLGFQSAMYLHLISCLMLCVIS